MFKLISFTLIMQTVTTSRISSCRSYSKCRIYSSYRGCMSSCTSCRSCSTWISLWIYWIWIYLKNKIIVFKYFGTTTLKLKIITTIIVRTQRKNFIFSQYLNSKTEWQWNIFFGLYSSQNVVILTQKWYRFVCSKHLCKHNYKI